VASTGTADAGKIVALSTSGTIDSTMLPAGVGANVTSVPAFEALSAGAFVNLFSDDGDISARLADNSNGRAAEGFVLAAVSESDAATVLPLGETNSGLTGLTVAAEYWLGAAGAVTATPPTSGVSQYLGKALSATELLTVRDEAITL
jgi:hypothetical protein